jgi:hypothetical protein
LGEQSATLVWYLLLLSNPVALWIHFAVGWITNKVINALTKLNHFRAYLRLCLHSYGGATLRRELRDEIAKLY